MGLGIVITIKGATKLPEKIKKIRVGVLARMGMMLAQVGEEVARVSVEDHLSGPRPDKLGRVSGDLARSINYRIAGNKVIIGSNLRYARIHEYGGEIKPISAPNLVFKLRDGGWRSMKKVTIPERSFLRSALRESKPAVKTIIERLVDKAIKEAMA